MDTAMTAERELQMRYGYSITYLSLLYFMDMAGFCPGAEVRESKFSDVILIQKWLDYI